MKTPGGEPGVFEEETSLRQAVCSIRTATFHSRRE